MMLTRILNGHNSKQVVYSTIADGQLVLKANGEVSPCQLSAHPLSKNNVQLLAVMYTPPSRTLPCVALL